MFQRFAMLGAAGTAAVAAMVLYETVIKGADARPAVDPLEAENRCSELDRKRQAQLCLAEMKAELADKVRNGQIGLRSAVESLLPCIDDYCRLCKLDERWPAPPGRNRLKHLAGSLVDQVRLAVFATANSCDELAQLSDVEAELALLPDEPES